MFKVGDRVKVKNVEVGYNEIFNGAVVAEFTEEMTEAIGKVATIKKTHSNGKYEVYELEGFETFGFAPEWIEATSENAQAFQVGDKVRVFGDDGVIISCLGEDGDGDVCYVVQDEDEGMFDVYTEDMINLIKDKTTKEKLDDLFKLFNKEEKTKAEEIVEMLNNTTSEEIGEATKALITGEPNKLNDKMKQYDVSDVIKAMEILSEIRED